MAVHRLSRQLVYGCRGMICRTPPGCECGYQGPAGRRQCLRRRPGCRCSRDGHHCASLWVGRDSFVLLYEAQTGKITGVNSSGVAASGATSAYYRTQATATMPLDGPHAVSVPGEVAAWEVIHQRFCTKPFAQLLDGAIGYAENGFRCLLALVAGLASNARKLAQFPSTASVLLRRGAPLQAGDVLVNADLARSLQLVATGGADEFYRGDLARRMVQGLEAGGGLFTVADFAGHRQRSTSLLRRPIGAILCIRRARPRRAFCSWRC